MIYKAIYEAMISQKKVTVNNLPISSEASIYWYTRQCEH